MLRLPADRLLPGKPQPGEVGPDARLVFRPAARPVDVLDPQQEAASGFPAKLVVDERRIGVAEMELAVRARCEAENGLHFGGGSAA